MLTDEFEQLVDRYHPALMRLAYAMSGDRALAEDAVQACWQAAWRSRWDIRDRTRIRGWLSTVTANDGERLWLLGGLYTPSRRPAMRPATPTPCSSCAVRAAWRRRCIGMRTRRRASTSWMAR